MNFENLLVDINEGKDIQDNVLRLVFDFCYHLL